MCNLGHSLLMFFTDYTFGLPYILKVFFQFCHLSLYVQELLFLSALHFTEVLNIGICHYY